MPHPEHKPPSFHSIQVAELRADHDLALKYLKVALQALDDPLRRAAGIDALRKITEAYCRREF